MAVCCPFVCLSVCPVPDANLRMEGKGKDKGMVLDIAPLTGAQKRFTTLEVAADWHWL